MSAQPPFWEYSVQGKRSMEKGWMHWREPSPGAAVISAVTQEGEAPSEYQVQSKAYLQTNRHQLHLCHRSFHISYRARVANHFQDPRVHWTPTTMDMVTGKAKHRHSDLHNSGTSHPLHLLHWHGHRFNERSFVPPRRPVQVGEIQTQSKGKATNIPQPHTISYDGSWKCSKPVTRHSFLRYF